MLLYAIADPGAVIKADRKGRENWQQQLGSLLYNLECRTLFDALYHLLVRRLPAAGGADLFHATARRQIDKSLPFGNPYVLGRCAIVAHDATRKLTMISTTALEELWHHHNAEWRDPTQIISQWHDGAQVDPRLLRYRVQGAWWETLAATGSTLLITREYEHLVMAMSIADDGPVVSYLSLPHPSGIAVDRQQRIVYIASTRNPNQIYDFSPISDLLARRDIAATPPVGNPLIPLRSRFFPGCLYMHDLALIGTDLYANAVGHNAIVQLCADGSYQRVWWPRCIETKKGPIFGQNHLQLNSIAANTDIQSSYFSASTDRISARRPGHKNFPVNRRGVIFAGATREPIAYGLTRPHSARLHQHQLWVDNSGYGEVGIVANGGFTPVAQLPGWTRGLCFHGRIAFVGTSRVIPRFRQYAPGLDVNSSLCAVHALDTSSGQVLGSLIWPYGNQICGLEWIDQQITMGFPFGAGTKRARQREKALFYAFQRNERCEQSTRHRVNAEQCGAPALAGNTDLSGHIE